MAVDEARREADHVHRDADQVKLQETVGPSRTQVQGKRCEILAAQGTSALAQSRV